MRFQWPARLSKVWNGLRSRSISRKDHDGANSSNGKEDLIKPRRKRSIWAKVGIGALLFFGGIAVYFLAVSLNLFWLFGPSPSMGELKNPKVPVASEIYTADSVLIGRYYNENRTPVKLAQIDSGLIRALIATEDVRYFQHHGIDWKATLRALGSVVFGGSRQGGSTITQQLAKNLYKTRDELQGGLLSKIPVLGTVIAKSKEWVTAVKLEFFFTKEEILELYLNTVDFGANAFGIKAASKTFFNTTPDSLLLEQSAVLIGLLKAPTTYSPLQNKVASRERRNVVLSQMVTFSGLPKSTADSIAKLPLVVTFTSEKQFDGPATYFRGAMNAHLKVWCKENGLDLFSDGLKIYTTIDSRMQAMAEETLLEVMKKLQQRFNNHWRGQNPWVDGSNNEIPVFIERVATRTEAYKQFEDAGLDKEEALQAMEQPRKMTLLVWDKRGRDLVERDTMLSPMDSLRHYKRFLHAGFVAEEPGTGKIRAWVGGINYKYFQYDHVMQGKRQSGSTFKPFVYAAALEHGYNPCDKIQDAPITINYRENGEEKSWSPHNATYSFSYANMTLRHAMARSINVIAAQLTERVGWDSVVAMAHRCGIKSPLQRVPSVGLGIADVSVLELTGAYQSFINGGIHIDPHFISSITDAKGKVVYKEKPKSWRAITPQTSFLMTHMLKGGLEEPGGTTNALFEYNLGFNKHEFGGKTGTTSNCSDGWFVGVSPKLIASAWVGGDDRAIHFRDSDNGEGSKTALPIVGRFLEKLYQDPILYERWGGARFEKPNFKIEADYQCATSWSSYRRSGGDDSSVVEPEVIDATLFEQEKPQPPPPTEL